MCGSDTFAIEVSSTSMNVARVTVSAITQGLIVPSGILSLDRILSLISFCSSSGSRSEEHTSELQSRLHLVCRLLLEKKKKNASSMPPCCTLLHRRHSS